MSELKLYNSLSRKIENFEPREGKKVNMFVCGPTVYDYVHIGNARTFTIFDVIAKWLRHRGYELNFIQNITDIDDRIIARAAEAERKTKEYAKEYEGHFLEDMKALSNDAVSQYARATDHIDQVIKQVKKLIEKRNVYLIDGDGWYFDLTTFPDYGKLSGRTGLQANDAVSRIDENEKKRNTGDFCVWKLSKPGEPIWEDAELGSGRPGWHIEDTAITEYYFGPQYDLHGGGIDLKFPHHEAEIAQQEAASGEVPFVKYWMHAGFLEMDKQKMSKSLGNFMTLREALKKYSPATLRFYLLSNHYRAPLDYSEETLASAANAVARIGELASKIELFAKNGEGGEESGAVKKLSANMHEEVESSMDNDFNTPQAFAAFFEYISEVNKLISESGITSADAELIKEDYGWINGLFGIIPATEIPEDVRELSEERQLARENKDWSAVDELKKKINDLGYTVDDTPYGPLVKKI